MEGWLRWVQGVEAALPVPAGTMGQDPDGQRTWALGKRRLPAGQSNAKALGMAQRSLFVRGSLKVGLYDGAWEAVSTASALQTGLGGVGKGRAPGKGKANASRPLLPASLLALPLPAMGTRTE